MSESTYEEKLQDLIDNDAPREEVVELMEKHNDHIFDLTKITKDNHNWVDRGAKLTCEGAAHAPHEVWKRM